MAARFVRRPAWLDGIIAERGFGRLRDPLQPARPSGSACGAHGPESPDLADAIPHHSPVCGSTLATALIVAPVGGPPFHRGPATCSKIGGQAHPIMPRNLAGPPWVIQGPCTSRPADRPAVIEVPIAGASLGPGPRICARSEWTGSRVAGQCSRNFGSFATPLKARRESHPAVPRGHRVAPYLVCSPCIPARSASRHALASVPLAFMRFGQSGAAFSAACAGPPHPARATHEALAIPWCPPAPASCPFAPIPYQITLCVLRPLLDMTRAPPTPPSDRSRHNYAVCPRRDQVPLRFPQPDLEHGTGLPR